MIRPLRIGILLFHIWPTMLAAQTAPETPQTPTATPTVVLDIPRLEALRDQTALLLQRGQINQADTLIAQAQKQTPDLPELHVMRAMVRMAQNAPDKALKALDQAVAKGFANLDETLGHPLLAPLRPAAQDLGLIARSSALPRSTGTRATRPVGQELPLTLENLKWDSQTRRFAVLLEMPETPTPVALPPLPKRARADQRAAHANLNRLINSGRAAGFTGLLYDNRDAGHSELDLTRYPGLIITRYAKPLKDRKINYGLADDLLYGTPVIGNSSTAYKRGKAPRSLPRTAMTQMPGPTFAYQNYMLNQFYVYPEHRDHDAVDLYPANWPYMIISQGSSYQDRPFVAAAAWALAAMRPDTRAFLEQENLMVPTLQMILRRAQAHVRNRATYLSGAAHPTVFQQDALRYDRIVALAQSLTPETVPPVPVLKVLSESFAPRAGLIGRSERLFNTPAAIARVWRGPEWEKEMIVAADTLGVPLAPDARINWVLLRGDPDRVRIEPLDAQGSRARLTLNWHDRRPIAPRAKRLTDRVDIGVIVTQGALESAPAFVSVSFPTHQERRYEQSPDGSGSRLLVQIDYDALGAERPYDPVLHWSAPWRDVYDYAQGKVIGWTRVFMDDTPNQHFTADGRFENGQKAAYTLKGKKKGSPFLSVAISPAPVGQE